MELNMADTNLKPGTTIAKTQSNFLAGNTEKHEVVRKNNNRSLPESRTQSIKGYDGQLR
jgi:hypothetical protein